MKLLILIILALNIGIWLVLYDAIDTRLSLCEDKYHEPQPLIIIQPERYSTSEFYVNGEKINAPND